MKKNIKVIRKYLPAFIFVIIFNIIVVTAVIVVHEEGHFFTGVFLSCNNMKIVLFDSSLLSTYTQMACPSDVHTQLLFWGGFLFVVPLALTLYFLKDFNEKYFCWVILGFNFIISSSDITVLSGFWEVSFLFVVLGTAVIVIGEILLADRFLVSNAQMKEL
jgi:hypothetical protein